MNASALLHRRGERGAILVQFAFTLVALAATASLAVDYGLLWLARGQAQNAADAGAIAGATTLGFDAVDRTTARQSASAEASRNNVWGEAGQIEALVNDEIPYFDDDTLIDPCVVPGAPPVPVRLDTCIRVNVYRDQAHANPLPTFFGALVGVSGQGVRAQATANVIPANTSACVWPLAIPDQWREGDGSAFDPATSSFRKYLAAGSTATATPQDIYTQPNDTTPGSGYTMSFDKLSANIALTLVPANFTMPAWPAIAAHEYVPVVVPRSDGGGFAANLASCNGVAVSIGDTLAAETGATLAAATSAADARVAGDATATWNPTALRIQSSCASGASPCAAMSSRLVLLPIFDVNAYEDARAAGTPPAIRVVNFVGFFINHVTGSSILGNFATYPGTFATDKPSVGYASSFLRTVVLTR